MPTKKILSFQPFSLYQNGGGSRILRRLYEGKEDDITSLAVLDHDFKTESVENLYKEYIVYHSPIQRQWMRWYLRSGVHWFRNQFGKEQTIKNIKKVAIMQPYDILHVVDHGPFSSVLCDKSILHEKKLWTSFHDHFSTNSSSYEQTEKLWGESQRRLVISKELGDEYNRIFGIQSYEIVTDGVKKIELSKPKYRYGSDGPLLFYFAGLMHIDYLPLLKSFVEGLQRLFLKGVQMKLILRGTQDIDFLKDLSFPVEVRPHIIDSDLLKRELDEVDFLYLPIKFSQPNFYKFSMSTKMVGYLGARGSILYHGPKDSAASALLSNSDSAVCCTSLVDEDVDRALDLLLRSQIIISQNAKTLAVEKFDYQAMKSQFWSAGMINC